MVDEAHATGVLGPGGRGSVAAAGLEGEVDVIVGTLGKALGSYGAYACCDAAMARYLVNTARTLIFSTGPPPPVAAAALAALEHPGASSRGGSSGCATTPRTLRDALWPTRASTVPSRRDADRARSWWATPTTRGGRLRAAAAARACSRRRSGRRRCPTARRGCASRRWRPTTPAELRRAAGAAGCRVRQGRARRGRAGAARSARVFDYAA